MILTFDLSTLSINGSIKYFELISAIAGTVYLDKYRHTHLKWFLPLLWYIVLTEFLGDYFLDKSILVYIDDNDIKYNFWIVNLLYLIFFPVVLYIYSKSITNNKYVFWIKIFLVAYIIISIINWVVIQNFLIEWNELPFVAGSLFLITTIIFYFIDLLQSEKIVIFHRTLLFWISVGLLVFHTGAIPFSIKLNGYALIPEGPHKLFLIFYVLAILMYLIFTFGFIWSKKESH